MSVLPTMLREPADTFLLANILPPPDGLSLPIVKLLTHPMYQSYQARTASLSLFANVFVNFIPPQWGAPTPSSVAGESSEKSKESKEWKRRIKMYGMYLTTHA